MRYQRTQIYLQPEAHRFLAEEAQSRGLSLTGLLREIVSFHLRERVAAYRPRGFDALIGAATGGEPTDVAHEGGRYLEEALDARLQKKLGQRRAQPAPKAPNKAQRRVRKRT